jgi:hypothetical protein
VPDERFWDTNAFVSNKRFCTIERFCAKRTFLGQTNAIVPNERFSARQTLLC